MEDKEIQRLVDAIYSIYIAESSIFFWTTQRLLFLQAHKDGLITDEEYQLISKIADKKVGYST